MTTVAVDTFLIERPTAYATSQDDTGNVYKVCKALSSDVPNLIAGGAGQAVTTTLAFSDDLPTDEYGIQVTPSQACAVSFANKAVGSVDVVLTPLTSGVTLSAGTFDVELSWTA